VDAAAFREEFPVLERVAYLNAGTDGPVPRRGYEAATAQLRRELEAGRAGREHFDRLRGMADTLRERLARLLGCGVEEVALTRSTTDGLATIFAALDLGPGDEVVTSDEEHPGLLAPLAAARRRKGFDVRTVPFGELGSAPGPRTRLVACSHVSWVNGQVVDTDALARSGALVALDGAQGLGAVPVDVKALGCHFYAASGQKWLCGPDGSGCLYARAELAAQLDPPWPSYGSLADATRPSDFVVHEDARRFDVGFGPGPATAWALAALALLDEVGFDWVTDRAVTQAARLADLLAERGREVVPRGRSTLVSWRSEDPEGDVERLFADDIHVRYLPGRGLVRASVGAWTSDEEIERLADATSRS
jgi:selenocysteine lyase/cysteine desulfurase